MVVNMEEYLSKLTVFTHPLIRHKVSHLCDVNTGTKEFSELVKELSMLMGYEVLKDLKMKDVEIQAPLQKIVTPVLAEDFTIVPILRAGLGMVDGLRALSPTAKVGHIGLYRDEKTLLPQTYYFKLPVDAQDGPVIVVDPALATGGSADAAIRFVKESGCTTSSSCASSPPRSASACCTRTIRTSRSTRRITRPAPSTSRATSTPPRATPATACAARSATSRRKRPNERAVRRGQISRHTANSPPHGQPVRRVCRFAGALSDFAALPVSIYNLFTDLTRFIDNYAAV